MPPFQSEERFLTKCGKWYQANRINKALEAKLQETKVQYHPNQVTLTKEGRSTLQAVAKMLKKHPYQLISVVGKTPLSGPMVHTMGYGRAETAAKYLKQLHVVNPM